MNGRLIVLHRRRYGLPGSRVSIRGYTLWSNVPEEAKGIVRSTVQDSKQTENWTVDTHNGSPMADLTWLQNEIESIQSENKTRDTNIPYWS